MPLNKHKTLKDREINAFVADTALGIPRKAVDSKITSGKGSSAGDPLFVSGVVGGGVPAVDSGKQTIENIVDTDGWVNIVSGTPLANRISLNIQNQAALGSGSDIKIAITSGGAPGTSYAATPAWIVTPQGFKDMAADASLTDVYIRTESTSSIDVLIEELADV